MTEIGILTAIFVGGIIGCDWVANLFTKKDDGYSEIFSALDVTNKEKGKTAKYLGMTSNNNYILLAFGLSPSLTSEAFQKNKKEVQEKLGVDNLEIYSKKGYMYFKIRKHRPPAIKYTCDKIYPDNLIPIGYDEDFNLILWNLSTDAHLIIGGATASGKTVSMHGMLNYIIRSGNYDVYLSDMKRGVDFNVYGFNNFHRIIGYANTVRQTQQLIAAFEKESDRRWNAMCAVGAGKYEVWCTKDPQNVPKRAILMIDEYPDLVPVRKTKDDVDYIQVLVELARKCRAVGMHIVISAQYPDAKTMPSPLKSNFTGKLGFRTSNGVCSRVVLGHVGCERLKVGQCYAQLAGEETFIRTALVTETDIDHLIEEHAYPSAGNIIDTTCVEKEDGTLLLLGNSIDVDNLFTEEFMEGL